MGAFDPPGLECLGQVFSKKGLKADPSKYKAIQEWPQPTNLQYFLGMANYYSKIMFFFAKIAAPL